MVRKELVLVSAGEFSREVLWQITENSNLAADYNIIGFVDNNSEMLGNVIMGLPILGDDKWLEKYPQKICAVICIGNQNTRKKIYDNLKKNPNISFPTMAASNVKHSDSVKFGQGCIVCLFNVLTVDITIGDFAIINLSCTIGHNVVLGDFVTVNPGVNISGNVRIGNCAEIGTGAKIIQGVNIGDNTIIGAGSVVVKNIPSNCTAVGVPAKPIKFH